METIAIVKMGVSLLEIIIKICRLSFIFSIFDGLKFADRETLNLVKSIFPKSNYKRILLLRHEDGGALHRGGIKHVVFRQDTIAKIFIASDFKGIFELGVSIGRSASDDLFNAIDRALVDKSVKFDQVVDMERIIALSNFWDQTGGWGNFQLSSDQNDEWQMTISDHFLINCTSDKISSFWEGYISGFIDKSYDRIEIIRRNFVKKDYHSAQKIVDKVESNITDNTVSLAIILKKVNNANCDNL